MKSIKNKLNALILVLVIGSTFGMQMLAPVAVFACGSATGSSQQQVLSGVDQTGGDCSGTQVTKTIDTAVNLLSIIIGAAAVIMILFSGFRYIISGGDSTKIATAKGGLLYALIGVLIAALAQFLVHFVLYQSTKA
jgi:hypothetical protein